MPHALSVRRLVRSRRGMSPLQSILLVAAALFVILALKQLLHGDAVPAASAGIDHAFKGTPTPTPTPAPAPTPTPAPTVPPGVVTQPMAEAKKKLDAIRDEVDLAYDASFIAYGRPTDAEGAKKFDDAMKRIQEKYDVEFFEGPAGAHGAVLLPRDPADKAILAMAGSDSTMDWVVNVGQAIGSPTESEAVNGVLVGAAEGSLGAVAASVGQYATGTAGRVVYDGGLSLANTLVQRYGAENVMLVGHSLGGGMMSYAGAMLGVRAIGFNSAPLGPTSLENIRRYGAPGAAANLTQINAAGEVVSSYAPGQQLGEVFTVQGRSSGWFSAFGNHRIGNIDTDRPLAYQPARRPVP